MWKIVVGFVVFAALAIWMLSKGGDIDMSGEKHGIETSHPAEPGASAAAVPAPVPASVPAPASAVSQ